jgi:hypothetical protein
MFHRLRSVLRSGFRDRGFAQNGLTSVGSIPGIDSQRLDSFGKFCGRVKGLDSKAEESIRLPTICIFVLDIKYKLMQTGVAQNGFAQKGLAQNGFALNGFNQNCFVPKRDLLRMDLLRKYLVRITFLLCYLCLKLDIKISKKVSKTGPNCPVVGFFAF